MGIEIKKNKFMDYRDQVDPEILEKNYLKTLIKRLSDDSLYYVFEQTIKELNERKEKEDNHGN